MALDARALRRAGKRRSPRREISAGAFAALMYLPTLVCLALVLAYPVLYAGYLSLHRVGLGQLRRGEFPFVGLENYARLFDDRLFWLALKNTFLFTGAIGQDIVFDFRPDEGDQIELKLRPLIR